MKTRFGRVAFVLTFAWSVASAQTAGQNVKKAGEDGKDATKSAAQNTGGTVRTSLQRRGADVLSRERNRSKANLCARAGPSDLSVGECYLAEGKVTNADYTEYVRVVGALLRLPPYAGAGLPGAHGRLGIDTAETTWLTYREQSCRAMIYQWEGGTLGRVNYPKCLLTVTWDHMKELADLYSGLWQ